ncbi:MAG: hypothetical protein ABEH38_09735 [Flavobacteriales bacterium]
MIHYVVTYDIRSDERREAFEDALERLGFQKESTNQTTFYGSFGEEPVPNAFLRELYNATNAIGWEDEEDTVTVYFPTGANIDRRFLKEEGNAFMTAPAHLP